MGLRYSHQFNRIFIPVNDPPLTVDFRPFTGCLSKTRGLVRVAELNGMELANICVFGDADNDTCMVADAGVGVAMANGSDATRAAADFVTASNDKDGIAIFIEEHLL